jgi:hypothetical protein
VVDDGWNRDIIDLSRIRTAEQDHRVCAHRLFWPGIEPMRVRIAFRVDIGVEMM